jgi:hypothetical protein
MAQKYFKNQFAVSGDTEAVPDDSVNTLVSYETGYTPEYELDPDIDPNGNYIGRPRMNQLFKDITGNLKQWQDSGYPEFVANDGTGNPLSYEAGRVVWLSGVYYRANTLTTTAPPSAEWDEVALPRLSSERNYLGVPFWHSGETPPVGAMEFEGQLLSRATYPELWAALNNADNNIELVTLAESATRPGCWNTGDGSTTFGAPTALADFIRVWDSSNAIDVGAVLGGWRDSQLKSHSHSITLDSTDDAGVGTDPFFSRSTTAPQSYPVDTDETGGDDTYPRHINWMLCFWYE